MNGQGISRSERTPAGAGASFLSQLESEKKEGSVSALKKIAGVLRVDLDDIV